MPRGVNIPQFAHFRDGVDGLLQSFFEHLVGLTERLVLFLNLLFERSALRDVADKTFGADDLTRVDGRWIFARRTVQSLMPAPAKPAR